MGLLRPSIPQSCGMGSHSAYPPTACVSGPVNQHLPSSMVCHGAEEAEARPAEEGAPATNAASFWDDLLRSDYEARKALEEAALGKARAPHGRRLQCLDRLHFIEASECSGL